MPQQWTHNAPNASPQAVADRFAADLFPGRSVVAFTGSWEGLRFAGSFMLRDGLKEYQMTADHYGQYTITF